MPETSKTTFQGKLNRWFSLKTLFQKQLESRMALSRRMSRLCWRPWSFPMQLLCQSNKTIQSSCQCHTRANATERSSVGGYRPEPSGISIVKLPNDSYRASHLRACSSWPRATLAASTEPDRATSNDLGASTDPNDQLRSTWAPRHNPNDPLRSTLDRF